MAILVPLKEVSHPQHLRCMVRGKIPDDPTIEMSDVMMVVYTGWITIGFAIENARPGKTSVISFVPLGTGSGFDLDIQRYRGPDAGYAHVKAVVTSTVSSFGEAPSVVAVDDAAVVLVPKTFPSTGPQPQHVLMLTAQVAIQEGVAHAVAHQVTVLSEPNEPLRAFDEYDDIVLRLDRTTTP